MSAAAEPKFESCPLCGHPMDDCNVEAIEGEPCTTCPLASGCRLPRCSSCGYTLTPESGVAGWLRRWLWGAGASTAAGEEEKEQCLAEIPVGSRLEIRRIETRSAAALERLGSLGVLPGTRAVLHRRSPTIVLRVGESLVAIDHALARRITAEVGESTGP